MSFLKCKLGESLVCDVGELVNPLLIAWAQPFIHWMHCQWESLLPELTIQAILLVVDGDNS
jgi:hypothetical protein